MLGERGESHGLADHQAAASPACTQAGQRPLIQSSIAPGTCRQVDELQQQLRHSQGETAKLRDWQDITKQVHADRMQEAGQLAQAEQAKLQALVHQRWAWSSA